MEEDGKPVEDEIVWAMVANITKDAGWDAMVSAITRIIRPQVYCATRKIATAGRILTETQSIGVSHCYWRNQIGHGQTGMSTEIGQ